MEARREVSESSSNFSQIGSCGSPRPWGPRTLEEAGMQSGHARPSPLRGPVLFRLGSMGDRARNIHRVRPGSPHPHLQLKSQDPGPR